MANVFRHAIVLLPILIRETSQFLTGAKEESCAAMKVDHGDPVKTEEEMPFYLHVKSTDKKKDGLPVFQVTMAAFNEKEPFQGFMVYAFKTKDPAKVPDMKLLTGKFLIDNPDSACGHFVQCDKKKKEATITHTSGNTKYVLVTVHWIPDKGLDFAKDGVVFAYTFVANKSMHFAPVKMPLPKDVWMAAGGGGGGGGDEKDDGKGSGTTDGSPLVRARGVLIIMLLFGIGMRQH